LEASLNKPEIAVCLPTGEEHWLHAETGQVVELDSQDIKALEDRDRTTYLNQVNSLLQ
jgi:hypothetical protein